MNRLKSIFNTLAALVLVSAFIVLVGCGKDDDGPTALTVKALTAGESDLNGSTSPSDVALDASLTVTFSTEVDGTTADANISLTRDYDGADIPLTIAVSGRSVTITPKAVLGSGSLYKLVIAGGLMSADGEALTDGVTRTFTTDGTFAPAGAIAYWNFDDDASDVVGSYSPASSDVVDITYVNSRTAAAGKAASFNGKTSIIEIPNGDNLATTSALTVSFWLSPDSSAHHGGNFVFGVGGFHGFEFELNKADAKMAAQYVLADGINSASQDLWLDGKGLSASAGDFQGWTFSKDLTSKGGFASIVNTPNAWSHFVLTYDAATHIGSIYLNGELVKAQDFSAYPENHTLFKATNLTFSPADGVGTKLAIGFYSDRSTTAFDWAKYSDLSANHYAGLIDDVRIYHQALTEKEITLMYNSEKP